MKINKGWVILNIFTLSAFLFLTCVLYNIPTIIDKPTKEIIDLVFKIRLLISLMAIVAGMMFVFGVFKGDMFYERIEIPVPHKNFEVREYENKTIIAYKNYAHEFEPIRDKSESVKCVIMKYYYDMKKDKIHKKIVGFSKIKKLEGFDFLAGLSSKSK